jgi:hypothetical protein
MCSPKLMVAMVRSSSKRPCSVGMDIEPAFPEGVMR